MPLFNPGESENYYTTNPEAGFYSVFGQAGGDSPFAKFLRGKYQSMLQGYNALAPEDPSLQWRDYLRRQNPDQDWANMAPQSRGERPSQFAPRTRYLF